VGRKLRGAACGGPGVAGKPYSTRGGGWVRDVFVTHRGIKDQYSRGILNIKMPSERSRKIAMSREGFRGRLGTASLRRTKFSSLRIYKRLCERGLRSSLWRSTRGNGGTSGDGSSRNRTISPETGSDRNVRETLAMPARHKQESFKERERRKACGRKTLRYAKGHWVKVRSRSRGLRVWRPTLTASELQNKIPGKSS